MRSCWSWKRGTDGMSRFRVTNVLRTDIVIHDINFNNSGDMADYLSKKNPQVSYTNIITEEVAVNRKKEHKPLDSEL